MAGVLFSAVISVGLPLTVLLYAFYRKRYMPFVLGVLAFVISQVFIRIPILQYLGEHSIAFSMFSAMHPVLFAIAVGLSAGIVEELARFIAMRFLWCSRIGSPVCYSVQGTEASKRCCLSAAVR